MCVGLSIGLSWKLRVVDALGAGTTGLASLILTFLLKVRFCTLSDGRPPKSRPSIKSSFVSASSLDFLCRFSVDGCSMTGLGTLASERSASAARLFFKMASKSSGPSGMSRPPASSWSLSSAIGEPTLGLMQDTDDSRASACLVPANRVPRLPSKSASNSSKPSSSSKPAGGSADRGFSVRGVSSMSMSLSQSSSTFCRVVFFPSRLIVPPSNALDGMPAGSGMPACLADCRALAVDSSSFGCSIKFQSSSPATDSEHTLRREEMLPCAVPTLMPKP